MGIKSFFLRNRCDDRRISVQRVIINLEVKRAYSNVKRFGKKSQVFRNDQILYKKKKERKKKAGKKELRLDREGKDESDNNVEDDDTPPPHQREKKV